MSSRVVGATLAVVTPETRDFPRQLKRDLDLKVLSDIDYGVGVSYGVLFRVPDETKAHYSGLGFDLGARHGAPDWMRSWSPTSRYARNRRKSWPRRAGPLPRPSTQNHSSLIRRPLKRCWRTMALVQTNGLAC